MIPGLPTPRWVDAVIAGAALLIPPTFAASSTELWLGSWGETGAIIEASTLLLYPALAGLAAWLVAGARRAGYQPLIATACRAPMEIYARVVLRLGLVACAGISIAALLIALPTAMRATFASPTWVILLVVIMGVFASLAAGVLAGRFLPTYVSAPLAAAGVFAFGVFPQTAGPSLAALEGFAVALPRDRTYYQSVEWLLALRAVWLMSVAIFLTAVVARSRRWAFPSFAAGCLLAAPLALFGTNSLQVNQAAYQERCRDYGNSRVCLTAARDHLSKNVWRAYRPAATFVDPLGPGGVVLREQSLRGTGTTSASNAGKLVIPIGTPFGVTGEAHRLDRAAFLGGLTESIFQSKCEPAWAPPKNALPPATANDALQRIALESAGVKTSAATLMEGASVGPDFLDYSKIQTFVDALRKSPESTRHSWERKYAKRVLACRVTAAQMDELKR